MITYEWIEKPINLDLKVNFTHTVNQSSLLSLKAFISILGNCSYKSPIVPASALTVKVVLLLPSPDEFSCGLTIPAAWLPIEVANTPLDRSAAAILGKVLSFLPSFAYWVTGLLFFLMTACSLLFGFPGQIQQWAPETVSFNNPWLLFFPGSYLQVGGPDIKNYRRPCKE
ncbi:hypothetical protein [Foetidibacter luteolus]|uniref:hypothetical protein n=1 Tax=Foetidibacter luteolus TaxID=2608880 RepID=UPI00129B607E|nr:hypothetical protein [Foetidibacter luteolus]